jgi:hypothetical protein
MGSNKEEKRWYEFSRSHVVMLTMALASIALFVFLQETAKDNRDFLLLMFSSFAFPAIGTLLTLKVFAKSSGVEKKLCLAVAAVFIVALGFVANSLVHVPRGGFYNRTEVTPSSFTLTAERSLSGGSYSGEYSQIIHTANYPESSIWVLDEGSPFDVFLIRSQAVVQMNATLYLFMELKPYEQSGSAIFSKSFTINESQNGEYMQPHILILWGDVDPAHRTRLDGYDLELMIRVQCTGPDVGPAPNFTVDMSNFRIIVDDYIVDSELQNGLSIALTGVFIGIIMYIPGRFLYENRSKKT